MVCCASHRPDVSQGCEQPVFYAVGRCLYNSAARAEHVTDKRIDVTWSFHNSTVHHGQKPGRYERGSPPRVSRTETAQHVASVYGGGHTGGE